MMRRCPRTTIRMYFDVTGIVLCETGTRNRHSFDILRVLDRAGSQSLLPSTTLILRQSCLFEW